MRSFFFTLIAVSFGLLFSLEASHPKFDAKLKEALESHARVPAIAVFNPIELGALGQIGNLSAGEIEYLRKEKSEAMQERLVRFLNDETSPADVPEFKGYWTTNIVSLTATKTVLEEVADRFPEVNRLVFDDTVQLTYRVDRPTPLQEYTYGLQKMGIPELRRSYPELTGRGVVVGILDTGIDGNHPEFEGRVVAFADFIQGKKNPYDDNSHGTHVAGTIAGSGVGGVQIGVAPEATLVIGKILSGSGSGSLSGILRGMEWITNPEGRLNSSLRPQVVNNSWGAASFNGDIRSNPFAQHVLTWVEMGIFPVFAAGNSGRSGTSTIGDPAGLPNSYAIGATDENDRVTDFSSRGPVQIIDRDGTRRTLVKPDVSAPGARVYSAVPGGDYKHLSGTSMAAPHVAGAIALLYQANPKLTIGEIAAVLETTADYLGESEKREKSNDFGMGRVNLFRAVDTLSAHGFYSGW